MKISIISLLLFLSSLSYARIIREPQFSARNTTTIHIDSIDLRLDLSRFYISCKGIPNQWTTISNNMHLSDPASGKKWVATDIDGTDFNYRFQFPESGKLLISIDFPPLPSSIEKVDLIDDKKDRPIRVIDICLSPSKEMEEAIPIWKTNIDTTAYTESILYSDSAHIEGYIKHYHPRLNMGDGVIYLDNILTNETQSIPVKIDKDGHFKTSLLLHYPVQQTILFSTGYLNFYIEPGKELMIITDMEDLGKPFVELTDIEDNSTNTSYAGRLSTVNQELKELRRQYKLDIKEIASDIKNLTPSAYRQKRLELFQKRVADLANKKLSSKTQNLALLNLKYQYARFLLEYDFLHNQNQLKMVIPADYYSFLKELPLNNPLSLSTEDYKVFIDRLEHAQPLKKASVNASSILNGFQEIGIALSPDDKELIRFSLQMKSMADTARFYQFNHRMSSFNDKYKDAQITIREKSYTDHLLKTFGDWGLQPNFTSELILTRRFRPRLQEKNGELTATEYDQYTRYVRDPYLIEAIHKLYTEYKRKQ